MFKIAGTGFANFLKFLGLRLLMLNYADVYSLVIPGSLKQVYLLYFASPVPYYIYILFYVTYFIISQVCIDFQR